MLFVLSKENFDKFYNMITLIERYKQYSDTDNKYWLDYLHSPTIDGFRDIMFSTVYKKIKFQKK